MISAVKALPMEHQPLIVGLPSAHSDLSLLAIISENNLGKFDVEVIANALDAAFTPHAREVGAPERRFGRGERKGVDRDHARFQFRHRAAGAERRTGAS